MTNEEVETLEEIHVTVINVGVNMGDHAQDTMHALAVEDTMTIRDLMETVFPDGKYNHRSYSHRIELRFAMPLKKQEELF